jgi:hypothetical protein
MTTRAQETHGLEPTRLAQYGDDDRATLHDIPIVESPQKILALDL